MTRPQEPTDQELAEHLMVMRAQLGDRDALRGLHERYHQRLLYYLRRIIVPKNDADDVLQEIWIKVIRKIATLQQPEAFKAWLYRIAHNRAVSRLRGKRSNVSLDDVADELEANSGEAEPEDGSFTGFAAADVHAGLGRLTPAHREVLTLRFLEELSYEEIAEILDCSLGTVRSRIHYAKKSLYRDLTQVDSNDKE